MGRYMLICIRAFLTEENPTEIILRYLYFNEIYLSTLNLIYFLHEVFILIVLNINY